MEALDLFRLDGKTVLVTGASSGIGQSIAEACAEVGARVVLHGRNEQRLGQVLKSLQGEGHGVIAGDLNDFDHLFALVDQLPELDGVVHCAGIDGVAPMRMVQPQMLENVFRINYMAPMVLTQRLLQRKKIRAHGAILFMSSIAAKTGKVGVGPYSGSKAALLGTMRPLALEVAKHGMRVNALCPGIVLTPLFDGFKEHIQQDVAPSYPLGLGEPQDVAYAAVFFLADASRKITGTDFSIDGGVPFT
jgi:NAD(P)-dependent dehydrogenase (short-subunit alcohol dehydrogenase family)